MSLQQPVELGVYDLHFTDEQTEGQREVTCLGLYGKSGFEPAWLLASATYNVYFFFFFPFLGVLFP